MTSTSTVLRVRRTARCISRTAARCGSRFSAAMAACSRRGTDRLVANAAGPARAAGIGRLRGWGRPAWASRRGSDRRLVEGEHSREERQHVLPIPLGDAIRMVALVGFEAVLDAVVVQHLR